MVWQSLTNTLNSKPRVLAGPLLRKVTPTDVTVWLALRMPGTVMLIVLNPSGEHVMEGQRHTVAIGTNLHIVAVTANLLLDFKELVEGVVYRYDLTFDFDLNHQSPTLATATANALLAYPPFDKPTFCMPPKDVNSLRLIHGSCRKPHADGKDMLPLVDDLIAQTAATPLLRPHQLLLTGDQIYADDVAASMLVMLTDASDALLIWKELLPVPSSQGGPKIADKLPPYWRRHILSDAGFTSEDLDGHLMSLGEYLCMYLFVWSGVLWPELLPTFEDIFDKLRDAAGVTGDVEESGAGKGAGADKLEFGDILRKQKKTVDSDVKSLETFRNTVGNVRRALANIPTYMILDDHEVTDDWNMTLDIALAMYGNELGRRVIQNGLFAYSLCQHWGNVPEQFAESDPSLPGTRLLRLLDKGDAAAYESNALEKRSLVGIHTDAEVRARGAVFHDPNSLTYNYTVEGVGHQVIFTDTRTWRSFPRGGGEAPDLLPPEQYIQQIQNAAKTRGRALLVVISTNAPPIQSIRSATRHDWISNHARHFPDIHEAWDLPSNGFDRLIKALTDKLPVVDGELHGPVILLSGDVHTSFASRLLYKATRRFEDTTPKPTTAVVAQLVASSLLKENEETRDQHRVGYRYAPYWFLKPLIGPHVTEYYAGWNVPPNSELEAYFEIVAIPTPTGNIFRPIVRTLKTSGSIQLTFPNLLKTPPDYIYQLDYLGVAKNGAVPLSPKPLPPLPAGATLDKRKEAAQAFNVATGNYRRYNMDGGSDREIIGVNNVCEVTFDWPTSDQKKVIHTVRWKNPNPFDPNVILFVDYVVSLDPKDSAFPYEPKRFTVMS